MARQNLAAVIETPKTPFKIVERLLPTPGPDEVVIRNHAIAANPVDWKIQDFDFAIKSYPTVLGSDVCGVVTEIGSGVTKYKPGDRVTGFAGVIYNSNPDHGAWQQYTVLRELATTKIPERMSFEEGSVFPMAGATTAVAFFECLDIPIPTKIKEKPNEGEALLVWGAASSVGTIALQVARNLGFRVFATASKTHHEKCKRWGAEEVFDYHDDDVVAQIVKKAEELGTPIKLGFDAVGEGDASKSSADVISEFGTGGKLCLVLPWNKQYIQPERVELSETAAYKAFNQHKEMGKWFFNEYLANALEDGSIVSAPELEVIEGGVEQAQNVLDKLKKGVSGKKLVVKVNCDHHE